MTKKDKNSKDPEVLDAEFKQTTPEKALREEIIEIATKKAVGKELEILKELLPATQGGSDLVPFKEGDLDPLKQYIKEISRYKLLSQEEEKALVAELQETGERWLLQQSCLSPCDTGLRRPGGGPQHERHRALQ